MHAVGIAILLFLLQARKAHQSWIKTVRTLEHHINVLKRFVTVGTLQLAQSEISIRGTIAEASQIARERVEMASHDYWDRSRDAKEKMFVGMCFPAWIARHCEDIITGSVTNLARKALAANIHIFAEQTLVSSNIHMSGSLESQRSQERP